MQRLILKNEKKIILIINQSFEIFLNTNYFRLITLKKEIRIKGYIRVIITRLGYIFGDIYSKVLCSIIGITRSMQTIIAWSVILNFIKRIKTLLKDNQKFLL